MLLFVLLLAGLWSGAWYGLTGLLRDRFETSLVAARAQGWVVSAGRPVRAGFPLAVALVVPGVTGAGGGAMPVAGSVHARRLELAVALAHPATLAITFPEGFEVRRGHGPPIEVRATTLVGTVPLIGSHRITVAATGLTVASAGRTDASVTRARVVLAPRGPDLGFGISATGLGLPPNGLASGGLASGGLAPGGWPLGNRIAVLRADGVATGALAAPPANGVQGTVGWLEAWRTRGGALLLDRLVLDWGTLGLTGSGRVALDAALQPDATATLDVQGYNEAIAAMVRTRAVAPGPALAAQFALGLLAKPGKAGAPPRIHVTAALHGGRLTLGGVELGRVAKLSWSGMP